MRIISGMPKLAEVHHLTKKYGDLVAVDRLSFDLEEGQILGLVGPNGAGKTTALRALAGIHPPTEGQISICGFNLQSDPVEAKREIAFMSDEPRLFDYLTVEEHLQFVARIYGVQDYEARAEKLLDEFELSPKKKAFPAELSRGMKQKLMIACGFLHRPRLLIFDEPLTGLDPLGIRNMKESIARRARHGAGVILSSHLLHLVEELCTVVLIIQKGKRVAYGTIDDIKWQIARGRGDVSLEEAFLRITADDSNAASLP
jgi:ABC-2 type transport system ATP-binding protein